MTSAARGATEREGRRRRFSGVGAVTGVLLALTPLGSAYLGGSGFAYVGFFFVMFAMVFAPVLALFCGALPMFWPSRWNAVLSFLGFLGLCASLALYAGGVEGLVIGLMFLIPIFFVGLFGIAVHMARQPWDGRD